MDEKDLKIQQQQMLIDELEQQLFDAQKAEAQEQKQQQPRTRAEILDAAKKAVTERANEYGSPEDNFAVIGEMWAYLDGKLYSERINSSEVALRLIMLKIARIISGHGGIDNWVDIAGYAACGGELAADGD